MEHPFVHLHVHTEYSLLDGAIRCGDLAARTAQWHQPAVAMTDHGVMYGAVEFFQACKSAGVKPIIGCEMYVAPEGIQSREKRSHHLILLAKDDEGYHNLVKLVSIANTDGFYYKPRIDHDLLARYSKGLIASSACLAGEVSSLLLAGEDGRAFETAQLYRDIMGPENYYLEIMSNTLPEQVAANKLLVEMARRNGFPLIATNDSHYLNPEDFDWHELLLCVGTNKTINDPGRMSFEVNDFYLRSPEEMWNFFGAEVPDALTNTVEIAERCSFEFKLKTGHYSLPKFDVPEGETLDSFLAKGARAGLEKRLGGVIPPEYEQRLQYELGIISQMGFSGYFLIIADVIQACKNRHIPIGPGRGSAAGSLVAYAMRITELDPLRFGLIFERFLNPERISMPDIDTDVSDKGREALIRYVIDKYGVENVSQIITFGRMKSKAAIKDVGRAMGLPYADVDKVAKLVPDGVKSIAEAIEQTPDLKSLNDEDPQVAELLDSASKMEGLARHCSQHAAGVVITPMPLTDVVPVRKIGENQVVTQFSMEPVENLGLVKMDFLGLQTLSILEDALENIRENGKGNVNLEEIPLDDPEVFKLLQNADTLGIFQLESPGMRRLIRRMVPDSFNDLVAILALYRPGPLESGMVDQYVDCKHGERVHYLHPKLEPVLKETYGVVLYQEQVMKCASVLAGYTLGGADLLRRAMGKKKIEVMNQQRAIFVEGALKNGIDKNSAENIFDIIQKFAGYGFNKSHSAAYALISYQTAWLKTHYPKEFMAAYLTSKIGAKKDVMASYVKEVRSSGIDVLAPDINESRSSFTAAGEVIRFGLGAVSRMGENAVSAILESRKAGGPFKDMWDFVTRVDLRHVNKAALESLIKAGAFDCFSTNRRQLLEAASPMVDAASRLHVDDGQASLFGDLSSLDRVELPDVPDDDLETRLAMEKEVIGMYISGHPIDQFREVIQGQVNATASDLAHWHSQSVAPVFAGLLTEWKERITKRGDAMGVLRLDDGEREVEVVCFPKSKTGLNWLSVKPLLFEGKPYLIEGRLDDRGDGTVIASRIVPLEGRPSSRKFLEITLEPDALRALTPKRLLLALKSCPGPSSVILKLVGDQETAAVMVMGVKVSGGEALRQALLEQAKLDPEAFDISA
ncbi:MULTISPECIES: DNA polymerase III subunit alpha [Jonquetella]|uniref:DNA polymerase III subunit alpha n=1 Tax=Jonquetella TaxID=428711 RepID=UPI0001B9117F|nr:MULTISPECIES: DNA polymerase III subunit alpha [Jonquetella]EEX48204.1 DNA polymerase III, alpha subunit [Jonquetella anthropi E3_33 E1]ERL24403.1 DNA polymerase III, alpha subunit [Jonquetella sp. BV3C21]